MLSVTSEYALRALICLSSQQGDEAILGRDLAERARVPANYLAKILNVMKRAGILEAYRGTGGGYRLLKKTDEIHLMDVVELFDGKRARVGCLLDGEGECSDESPCSAHESWGGVMKAYLDFLEETTVCQIAPAPGKAGPGKKAPLSLKLRKKAERVRRPAKRGERP